jgi:hypothetical protein
MLSDDPLRSYFSPPRRLTGFPDADPIRGKTGMGKGKIRKRWRDSKTGHLLEWDYQHGRIEKYDSRGKHIGEFDPSTGNQTKPPDRNRSITPTFISRRKKVMFYLTWYDRRTSGLVGEVSLQATEERTVRALFSLPDDQYPGDCLIVGEDQKETLEATASVAIDLDRFDYFVEYSLKST